MDKDTDLCAGCFRTIDEIAAWLNMPDETRRDVLKKVEERKKALQPKTGWFWNRGAKPSS